MAEEIHNAAIVLPRAIMLSVLINGILGFSMLIAILFCMGNIQDALNSPTGYPFIEIFFHSTGSITGAVLLCTIVLLISMFGVMGMIAAASRQFWSFSRDRAIPGWRLWVKVSQIVVEYHLGSGLSYTGIAVKPDTHLFHSHHNSHCLAAMSHEYWIRSCAPRYPINRSVRHIPILPDGRFLAALSPLQGANI